MHRYKSNKIKQNSNSPPPKKLLKMDKTGKKTDSQTGSLHYWYRYPECKWWVDWAEGDKQLSTSWCHNPAISREEERVWANEMESQISSRVYLVSPTPSPSSPASSISPQDSGAALGVVSGHQTPDMGWWCFTQQQLHHLQQQQQHTGVVERSNNERHSM